MRLLSYAKGSCILAALHYFPQVILMCTPQGCNGSLGEWALVRFYNICGVNEHTLLRRLVWRPPSTRGITTHGLVDVKKIYQCIAVVKDYSTAEPDINFLLNDLVDWDLPPEAYFERAFGWIKEGNKNKRKEKSNNTNSKRARTS